MKRNFIYSISFLIFFISTSFGSSQSEDENYNGKRSIKNFSSARSSKVRKKEVFFDPDFLSLPKPEASVNTSNSFSLSPRDQDSMSFRLSAYFEEKHSNLIIPFHKIFVKIKDQMNNKYRLELEDTIYNEKTGLYESYKYNDRIELIHSGKNADVDKIIQKIGLESRLKLQENCFPLNISFYFTKKSDLGNTKYKLKTNVNSLFTDPKTKICKSFVALRLIIKEVPTSSENECHFELIPAFR